MAPTEQVNRIAQYRQLQEQRLRVLAEIEAVLKTDPSFFGDLVAFLGTAASIRVPSTSPRVNVPEPGKRGRRSLGTENPAYQAIKNALRDTEWMGSKQIQEAAGLTKSKYFTVVKMGVDTDELEMRPDPSNHRAYQWRLKPKVPSPQVINLPRRTKLTENDQKM
jgi:hypothetical protein